MLSRTASLRRLPALRDNLFDSLAQAVLEDGVMDTRGRNEHHCADQDNNNAQLDQRETPIIRFPSC